MADKPARSLAIASQPAPLHQSSGETDGGSNCVDYDDPELAITTSFNTIVSEFVQHCSRTACSDVEAVDKFLKDKFPGGGHLANIAKQPKPGRTFLYFLLKAPKNFEQRLPLFHWTMKNHPNLYLKGVNTSNCILTLATKKCKASPKEEYISKLVTLYPSQLANILRISEHRDALLIDMLPFIRTSAGPEFLTFFGTCPQSPKQNEIAPTAVESPDQNIERTEVGDVITLRAKHTVDRGTIPEERYPKIQRVDASKRGDGATLLHLAAKSLGDCEGDSLERQYDLVERVFFWRPDALVRTDSEGRSPYLHRAIDFKNGRLIDDKIAFFLKDQIMHLDDRDLVLDLLYGKLAFGRTSQDRPHSVTPSSKPDEPGIRQEREVHLDLRELQDSRHLPDQEGDLLAFIKNLEFEDILQYVQIPRHPFRSRDAFRSPADGVGTKPEKKGTGRRDFESIFKLLYDKGVRKILRLIVDDDDICLHQDDVIESLHKFEIEDFEWRKMDVPSVVLQRGIPQVRTLHLFSSGNHSVLRDWSSSDGLMNLSGLESVHVDLYWNMESQARAVSSATDFIQRMVRKCPRVRSLEVNVEPLTSKYHDEWRDPNFLVTTNKWLLTMQKVATTIENVLRVRKRQRAQQPESRNNQAPAAGRADQVRVAILDDGVDWFFANGIGCKGRSFYTDRRQGFVGRKVWYSSSNDHGTLMAALVRKICPNAMIYVARLDQTQSEQGVFQPTPESAAKVGSKVSLFPWESDWAIEWAIDKHVHIISMSWTIPGSHPLLEKAVRNAKDARILMFGAASDQGANTTDSPYMAKLSKGSESAVICIGGAREAGYGDKKALDEAEFFFPGVTQGIPEPLPHIRSDFRGQVGSSVATALATGFTALIMLLVNISPLYGGNITAMDAGTRPNKGSSPTTMDYRYRGQLQNAENIRKIFQNLANPAMDRHNDNRKTDRNTIIDVNKYFRNKVLSKISEYAQNGSVEQALQMLDTKILHFILRPLIDEKHEMDSETSEDSDDEEDGENDDE